MRLAHAFLLAVLAALLSACGGGSSAPGNAATPGQVVSVTYSVALAITDASGSPVSFLTGGTDYKAVATVQKVTTTQATGFPARITTKPAAHVSVAFTADASA